MRLTKTSVEAARYQGEGKAQDIRWDDVLPGFGVRVYPSGAKSFVVSYRVHGRKRIVTLGSFGRLKVQEAREKARRSLVAVLDGQDPLERPPDGVTVEELARRYLEEHAIPKKKARSVEEDRGLLRRTILPRLGRRPVDSVNRQDVARLHHSLRGTPYSANRTLALLSKMMNLAEKWGLRPDGTNPCRHVERFKERRRDRFLSAEELVSLGEVLEEAEREATEHPSAVLAIRLLLLTGARKSEILRLRWEEVDLEHACLRLADSKTGEKVLALGAPPLELLDAARGRQNGPFVCPGKFQNAPLIGLQKIWERLRARAGLDDVRLHDLRHSFASVGASGGETLLILGALLGHRESRTTERYSHFSADPLRQAADRIAGEINAALSGKTALVSEMEKRGARPAG